MRRYFKLCDDVAVPGRWHLGAITFRDGSEPDLDSGLRLDDARELFATVDKPGVVLDFSLTSFAVPVALGPVSHAVVAEAAADVQCIPVTISGQTGAKVLNSVRVLPCLDERRSEFLKWTNRDHRADLAGQYRQVTSLVVDPDTIPADAAFFRVEGWLVALIVSERVKAAMERAGCAGAKFIDVMTPQVPPC